MIRLWARVVGVPVVGTLHRIAPPWWEEVPPCTRVYRDDAGTTFWTDGTHCAAATTDGAVY